MNAERLLALVVSHPETSAFNADWRIARERVRTLRHDRIGTDLSDGWAIGLRLHAAPASSIAPATIAAPFSCDTAGDSSNCSQPGLT